MKGCSSIGSAIFVLLIVTSVVLFLSYRKMQDKHVRATLYSTRCFSNMLTLTNMLGLYAQEHGGKLPTRSQDDVSGQISWAKAIKPYLAKRGYDADRKFYCPLTSDLTKNSDYEFNVTMYGKLLKEVLRQPDTIVLSETENRHYLENSMTVPVDMLRPYLSESK